MLDEATVTLALTRQTDDIDVAGIVIGTMYIRGLEDLRNALPQRRLQMQERSAPGVTAVLVETGIRYRKPVRLFDQPLGTACLQNLQRTRWWAGPRIGRALRR